jgi:hypothetical protein
MAKGALNDANPKRVEPLYGITVNLAETIAKRVKTFTKAKKSLRTVI